MSNTAADQALLAAIAFGGLTHFENPLDPHLIHSDTKVTVPAGTGDCGTPANIDGGIRIAARIGPSVVVRLEPLVGKLHPHELLLPLVGSSVQRLEGLARCEVAGLKSRSVVSAKLAGPCMHGRFITACQRDLKIDHTVSTWAYKDNSRGDLALTKASPRRAVEFNPTRAGWHCE